MVDIALVIALVATVTLAVAALLRDDTPVLTAETDTALRVSVIGDSYSSGLAGSLVWPTLVEEAAGWDIDNESNYNAGYVNTDGSGTFAEQIDRAVAGAPDVVLVVGGINDIGRPPELITQRAIDTLGALARAAPAAKIFVIGPIWHDLPAPEALTTIDDSVRSAAQMLRLSYSSVLNEDWLVPDGLIQDDAIHPTDAGQRVLAERITALLRSTGAPFV